VPEFQRDIGSVVLWRQHYAAYHLACVIDDYAQGITHVIRGADLFESTQIHVLLQHLLGYDTPTYCHHRLITDETGKRLAKRHDAKSIQVYRDQGATPADIRRMVGLPQITA
jgi:glutamyl-Q tRNA(Asp) synthetase